MGWSHELDSGDVVGNTMYMTWYRVWDLVGASRTEVMVRLKFADEI